MTAFVLGLVFGLGLGLLGLMLFVLLFVRDSLPRITPADFTAARQRWAAHGPQNYDLKLELTGNQSGQVLVEVRDGKPQRVDRQGGNPPPERTWDSWTVPGLLDVVELELDRAGDAADKPEAAPVIVRGEFDAEVGYPRRFRRTTLGEGVEIGWRVLSFEGLP
jgi:hypothetical protein